MSRADWTALARGIVAMASDGRLWGDETLYCVFCKSQNPEVFVDAPEHEPDCLYRLAEELTDDG